MPPSMPPMGLAYIAAVLRDKDHQVKVIDLNGNRKTGRYQLEEVLRKESFDLIGISSIITQYKKVKELGKIIKSLASEVPLVVGGPGPTSSPQLYLKNCFADLVCIGEGEETIKNIVFLLENKKSLDNCPGIMFKNSKGEYVLTDEQEPISNIDDIPYPAWNMFDSMSSYVDNFLFRCGRKKGMSIFTTRGCPGECIYCMCNFGRRFRVRSVDNISGEIESLIKNYNVEHIHFIDDTFLISKTRIFKICQMFKNNFKGITWSANMRADFATLEILKEMAEAKCIFLAYGIESGSPDILKYIKKRITPDQAHKVIAWTRQAGIDLRAYFIIGMPPETPGTIQQTVDFCKANLVGGEFFFATPIPGTELYDYALKNHYISNEDLYAELVGEVRNFLVNLTSMSNEELFKRKEEAESQIKEHLFQYDVPAPKSTRTDPYRTAACLPKF